MHVWLAAQQMQVHTLLAPSASFARATQPGRHAPQYRRFQPGRPAACALQAICPRLVRATACHCCLHSSRPAPPLQAIGVPISRLALYTACGGIVPSACLPVTIDAGTDNEALLQVGVPGTWAGVDVLGLSWWLI